MATEGVTTGRRTRIGAVTKPAPTPSAEGSPETNHGWRGLALAAAFIAACASLTTFPAVLTFSTHLPGGYNDQLGYLQTMRWYRTCLIEGRSPFLMTELHYPTGAPLGYFVPAHFQALIYLPLSTFLHDDVVCFNIIWFLSLLITGLGTYLMIGWLLRDRLCAAFGALVVLFNPAVRTHAATQLDNLLLGWVPFFLVAWLRFVDRPSRARLAAAAGSYLLVTMSATYYGILAAFPAALYVVGSACRAGRRMILPWFRARLGWFAAFGALALPAAALLFSSQIWAMTHGFTMARPKGQFEAFGVPPWSYVVPGPGNSVGKYLPLDSWGLTGHFGDGFFFLGVVPLSLLAIAAVRGTVLPRARFWWLSLGMLATLSVGAFAQFGSHKVPMPCGWLRDLLPIFGVIRAPYRFGLIAVVIAALLASAGLQRLLQGVRRRAPRAAIVAALGLVVGWELWVPLQPSTIPDAPPCYEFLRRIDPSAAIVEAPQIPTDWSHPLSSLAGYWQSTHRLRTTMAYSVNRNLVAENLTAFPSPFYVYNFADSNYGNDPSSVNVDLMRQVNLLDYIWLFLHAHDFRFVVFHEWPAILGDTPIFTDRVKELLRDARIYQDERTSAYDRERIRPPSLAIALSTRGWSHRRWLRDRQGCSLERSAHLTVYNPDPDRSLRLAFQFRSFKRPRTVRILAGPTELASWRVSPTQYHDLATPPFKLPAGFQDITILSDGDDVPVHGHEEAAEGDRRPYSLWVTFARLLTVEE